MSPEGLAASPADDAVSLWLAGIVGEPVRLVYLDDPTRRAPNPDYSQPGDRVSLADAYPLLLTSEASLDAVNGWIAGEPPRRTQPHVLLGLALVETDIAGQIDGTQLNR